jgi:anti-sigma regulatory factor (Ser/Thr protein kinase)
MRTAADRIVLPPQPSSAAAARRFVDKAFGRLHLPGPDLAALLTSELVTNAVLYSDGPISVEVEARQDVVRVSVTDDSSRPVRPRDVGLDATSGRGIAIVRRLAKAWGVDELSGPGKLVWFELPR